MSYLKSISYPFKRYASVEILDLMKKHPIVAVWWGLASLVRVPCVGN